MSVSIRAKLATIVSLLMLPIGVLAFLFIQQSFKDIEFADKERDGVTSLAGAWPVLRGLIEGGGSARAPRDLGRGGELAALDRTYGPARHVNEAASGTGRVAHDIGDVSRGANDTGAASAQVLSSAQALASESRRLKAAMDEFLGTVRAA